VIDDLSSNQPTGLRLWLPVGLLLLVATLPVSSSAPSMNVPVPLPIVQAFANPEIPLVAIQSVPTVVRHPAHHDVPHAIHTAELLVLELGLTTADFEAPIESLEWLVAYFQQGWGLDMAELLASYYSYFDGTHHFLRPTDDVLPPLLVATSFTVTSVNEQAAVVEAEFPAVDGPFQSPASTRLYGLLKVDGRWKIESVALSDTPSAMPRSDA